jgi:hypothetical protein
MGDGPPATQISGWDEMNRVDRAGGFEGDAAAEEDIAGFQSGTDLTI